MLQSDKIASKLWGGGGQLEQFPRGKGPDCSFGRLQPGQALSPVDSLVSQSLASQATSPALFRGCLSDPEVPSLV